MKPSRRTVLIACAALGLASPSAAEVMQSAPDGAHMLHQVRVEAPPAAIYALVGQVGRWWSSDHSYSGDAANMTLAMEPGGCFCEKWKDGAVEHARVILLMRDQVVRMSGALGPLQVKAVNGVLTFLLKPDGAGTQLTVGYRITGSSLSGLDKDAPAVDGVLAVQVQRLKRLAETGKPAP
jgi:uncharacterized protein YndB with AHSA1/START domain